jgi:hypothetical protein
MAKTCHKKKNRNLSDAGKKVVLEVNAETRGDLLVYLEQDV